MNRPVTPTANEVILYRTRDDYMTSQRLFAGGQTYPLKSIKHAQMVPARHFFPLVIARVAALAICLVYLVDLLGLVSTIEEPESIPVRLALVIVTALFAVGAGWFVPSFSLRFTLHDGRNVRAMWSNDWRALRDVAGEINALLDGNSAQGAR